MPVTILEIKQNTPEWKKSRENVVNGSDADVLLNRGLDAALKSSLNNFNGNFYTQRGHILEEEAIEVYEAINHCIVQRPGRVINSLYPNAGCSPDGIDQVYLLEVKCFGKKHMEIMTVKDIPFKVMAQIQFNMMMCELKLAKLILYNPDLAKKSIFVNGVEIPNPNYNPKEAYREIIVRANMTIWRNFKAKLEAKS